ncbi:MAG: DUF1343 domain-containing protein [Verrucomicrobia bacterium]|nr:DUF1343 domain-containing protein [Verrucomicrobiota bacterium]
MSWGVAAARAGESGVTPGIGVLLESRLDLVRGKNVGLITNPTGVDRQLRPSVECLRQCGALTLVALYGPEHGVRGNAQAGEYVPFYRDDQYGLPVFSLYGQSKKPAPGMLENIDAFMRSFDTVSTDKHLERGMVTNVEVMLFDIQDVGTRVYTYVATMAYAMEACAAQRIPFVVLDRPNPINGTDLEGPLLDYPRFSSFVGLYPIPVRHGMTAGELAQFFNARFLSNRLALTVVPVRGWRRAQWYDETGLPWVMPSPNMPTLDTATVYPGQVLLEGTNLSEGRGTTRPFELCGAPWLNGAELARRLNQRNLPGVAFREAWFTPAFSKFQGQRCGGCQVHVTDRQRFQPFRTTLHLLDAARRLAPDQFRFHPDYFDRLVGSSRFRQALERGEPVETLLAGTAAELRQFTAARQPYLIYP